MARHETLFSLRYAARVLERHSRLWRRVDTVLRFFSILSGTAAIAGLSAENKVFAMAAGIVFALMQAFDLSVRPAEKAMQSDLNRQSYSILVSKENQMDDQDLESAYRAAVADDDVIVQESVRRLAYNDVLMEMGLDTAHLYQLSRWDRFIGVFA